MRSTKELLQILLTKLESYPENQCAGLCFLITSCEFSYSTHNADFITFEEALMLRKLVNVNKPSIFRSWWRFRMYIANSMYINYYWKPYDKAPRIKWLKKQIKLHS